MKFLDFADDFFASLSSLLVNLDAAVFMSSGFFRTPFGEVAGARLLGLFALNGANCTGFCGTPKLLVLLAALFYSSYSSSRLNIEVLVAESALER